jgi:hypothetical protein
LPSGHQNKHTSRKTVDNNYRDYLRYSRRFLHRWLDQEGLVMNSYGG